MQEADEAKPIVTRSRDEEAFTGMWHARTPVYYLQYESMLLSVLHVCLGGYNLLPALRNEKLHGRCYRPHIAGISPDAVCRQCHGVGCQET